MAGNPFFYLSPPPPGREPVLPVAALRQHQLEQFQAAHARFLAQSQTTTALNRGVALAPFAAPAPPLTGQFGLAPPPAPPAPRPPIPEPLRPPDARTATQQAQRAQEEIRLQLEAAKLKIETVIQERLQMPINIQRLLRPLEQQMASLYEELRTTMEKAIQLAPAAYIPVMIRVADLLPNEQIEIPQIQLIFIIQVREKIKKKIEELLAKHRNTIEDYRKEQAQREPSPSPSSLSTIPPSPTPRQITSTPRLLVSTAAASPALSPAQPDDSDGASSPDILRQFAIVAVDVANEEATAAEETSSPTNRKKRRRRCTPEGDDSLDDSSGDDILNEAIKKTEERRKKFRQHYKDNDKKAEGEDAREDLPISASLPMFTSRGEAAEAVAAASTTEMMITEDDGGGAGPAPM